MSTMIGCTCHLLCKHGTVALRAFVNRIGAVTYCYQCQGCGIRRGDVKAKTVRNPKSVPPFDRALRDADHRRGGWLIRNTSAPDVDYESYLQSEEWAARRRSVMQRAGGRCELCQRAAAVQVHHLHYQSLGAEPLDDLLAVCLSCHVWADECRSQNRCVIHTPPTPGAPGRSRNDDG